MTNHCFAVDGSLSQQPCSPPTLTCGCVTQGG
jgi:hypothetical protein